MEALIAREQTPRPDRANRVDALAKLQRVARGEERGRGVGERPASVPSLMRR
jgi:hypothetical protein